VLAFQVLCGCSPYRSSAERLRATQPFRFFRKVIGVRCTLSSHDLKPAELIERFYDRKRCPELPFVEGDEVQVADGVYAGKAGEVVVLTYAETPMQYLVEFDDGTDEHFPESSLRLVRRDI
jgi:hypothetical protein